MTRETQPIENPEAFRAGVIETLKDYEISLVTPPGMPDIPALTYNPDGISYIREGYDSGSGYEVMEVRGDKVYIHGVLMTGVDDWEAVAGYMAAIIFDTRWAIARIKDLQTSREGGREY